MPLHKPNTLNLYHRQLVYCILKLIDTDFTLTEPVRKTEFEKINFYNYHSNIIGNIRIT